MAGLKRAGNTGDERNGKRTKVKGGAVPTQKTSKSAPVKKAPAAKTDVKKKDFVKAGKEKKVAVQKEEDDEEEDEFDIDNVSDSENENGDKNQDEDIDMGGMSDDDDDEYEDIDEDEAEVEKPKAGAQSNVKSTDPAKSNASRESHVKQKAVQQERKSAKPNADVIARSKQLWERLRRKSHVPLEERKKLIAELFDIISGRVKDFVFKHDSVRIIQTALKYANLEQRKQIGRELKGSYKELAQSRYAKFLIGKLIVHGDAEIRDFIIPEFYGHVKRLIRHPEASWILDDIYRTVATSEQRARLLREWYGPEFVLFKDQETQSTAELAKILEKHPEQRSTTMNFLRELINQLVQKKSTGFTMLHDAMLQYFLNTKLGSSDANEFIELLKGDEEGDLVKNLAFTKSGSRLMCLSLAHSNAKDRKLLIRNYRDTIKMMAGDLNGHTVILTAFEVIDDTKLTAKTFLTELLNQGTSDAEARNEELMFQVNDLTARIPILFPFVGDRVKWLLPDTDSEILKEVREIRKETSKKEPEARRQELVKAASPTVLDLIAARAESLLETSFGCQLVSEVLFDADGDKTAALTAVAEAAKSQADTKESFVGRLLKSLVQGGRFNPATKTVEKVQPPLNFHNHLYEQIKDEILTWATGSNVFVVVALAESDGFEKKDELLKTLKKNKKALEQASTPAAESGKDKEGKDGKKSKAGPTSSGARLLLETIQ